MRDATLCFLFKGTPPREILLGFKKVGFGQGKYGGFGGKVEAGETVAAAAVRELEEEAGVKAVPREMEKAGRLTFLFPARPAWDQVVHVFVVRRWLGRPRESVEMRPVWFKIGEIPFETMWHDCIYWLPLVLEGKKIVGRFTFNPDNETVAQAEIGSLLRS